MSFKATYDNVVVRPIEPDKTNSGGMVLAYNDKTYNKGKVLLVGPGRQNSEGMTIPMSIAVNDIVLYALNIGIRVNINDELLTVLKEDEVFATESVE
jgi:co-chaperonin GroES (HSP10)